MSYLFGRLFGRVGGRELLLLVQRRELLSDFVVESRLVQPFEAHYFVIVELYRRLDKTASL